ncbi:MAG TPA: hypothetical protein PLB49_02880 [Chitinophagaceae bacterium]|nr:hypothetical protein [Chitinophagaceae bacterium]
MLQNISWSQFWLVIILTSFIYYLFVWIIIYKAKFSLLKFKTRISDVVLNSGTDREDISIILGDLEEAFANKQNKSELILALQKKIQSYQEIDDPGFRDSVNRFILSESQNKCSIRLEEDDLRTLWK